MIVFGVLLCAASGTMTYVNFINERFGWGIAMIVISIINAVVLGINIERSRE